MEQNLVCAIIEENRVAALEVYENLDDIKLKKNQIVIDCTRIPCNIGDSYRKGSFYKQDGDKEVIISPLPDYSEEIEKIQKDNRMLEVAFADTLGGI